jgi:predicted AAA+ superfamily ATPase
MKNIPSFVENKGGLLENIVAVQLKRMGKQLYYYRHASNSEVDFILPDDKTMIQVCYELNQLNMKREVNGIVKANSEVEATKFFILTMEQEQSMSIKGITIEVLPVWKWLLDSDLKKLV